MVDLTRRGLLTSAAAAMVTLPTMNVLAQAPAASIGAGGPISAGAAASIDPLSVVDKELVPALQAMQSQAPSLPNDALANVTLDQLKVLLPQLREAMAQDVVPVPALANSAPAEERMIPGPEGAPQVRIFVIGAMSGARRPAVLHIHGGGFILGDVQSYVPFLQSYALALDCVVVSVDYRLAPETAFPGSLEDNYTALKWLYDNAEELGVDPTRIALAGESAGGGHAAMLSIAARDRGEVPVLFQALTYPMLDDRTGSTQQLPGHIGAFGWTPAFNRIGWKSLLGETPGVDAPAGAVPARVEDLSGLPPTWIGVGSIDLFVNEDIEFARRLVFAGVPTELLVTPGAYHGFDASVPTAKISQAFNLARANALARAFGNGPISQIPSFS